MKTELEKLTCQVRRLRNSDSTPGLAPPLRSALLRGGFTPTQLSYSHYYITSREFRVLYRLQSLWTARTCRTRVACSRCQTVRSTVSYIMRISTKLSHPFAHFTFFLNYLFSSPPTRMLISCFKLLVTVFFRKKLYTGAGDEKFFRIKNLRRRCDSC